MTDTSTSRGLYTVSSHTVHNSQLYTHTGLSKCRYVQVQYQYELSMKSSMVSYTTALNDRHTVGK